MRSQSFVTALSLLAGSAALTLPDQIPANHAAGANGVRPSDITNLNTGSALPYSLSSDTEQWRFDEGPPIENATGNLIFDTVNSLLQHWPNTRYRNGTCPRPSLAGARKIFHPLLGHNIVPGVIPTGTLLYHGTDHDTLPSGPEWTATDPEHSMFFSRGNESGWHLTLAATRPLKILYFDGNSAAKIQSEGTMDIQDIISWGEPRPDRWFDDPRRITDLCTWGKEFGIDGFVRLTVTHIPVAYN